MARPRSFDPDAARSELTDRFWRHGYDATSMQTIEEATGLKKQSLYRAFGDKRQMYLTALEGYIAARVDPAVADLDAAENPRVAIAALFDAILAPAAAGDRSGCFLCNASLDQAQHDAETQRIVAAGFTKLRGGLFRALARICMADPDAAASGLLSAYSGLWVLVRAGQPIEVLRAARDTALARI